jgi:hypothetical protein
MNTSYAERGRCRSGRQRTFPFLQIVLTILVLPLLAGQTQAMPSFSRQTGVACGGCHVGGFGPQLTAFGRQFKLNGYTQSDGNGTKVPLSVMDVATWTRTAKAQSEDAGPHDGPNNNFSIQQVSLFLAGRLSDHIGSFTQITYSDIDRKVVMDNMDVRYARPVDWNGHSGVFGISLNNNPGAQDPWNTAPAWRFPFIASELAPGPGAATLLEGGLGQQVLGASAYAFLDGKYYGELGAYRTLSASLLKKLHVDDSGSLVGITPYYRFNYTIAGHGQTLALGLTGLDARLRPERLPGPTNRYRDIGLDASYQYMAGENSIIAIDADAIHESQRRNAAFAADEAAHAKGHLDSFNLNTSWYYKAHYGLTAGVFRIRGDRDDLLYSANPDDGSRVNRPDSDGAVLQADWTPFGQSDSWHSPWANLRVGAQYTAYSKFNGASRDYDGFGRDASDNNTFFVFVWNAF